MPDKEKDVYELTGKMVAIFLAVTALLAVYVNMVGGSYSGKASGQVTEATRHMLNATDWWSYYQAHKLRSTMYYASFMQAIAENESAFSNVSTAQLFSKLNQYDDAFAAKLNASADEKSKLRNDFIVNLIGLYSTNQETKSHLLQEYLKGAEKSIAKAEEGRQNAIGEETKFQELMKESAINSGIGSRYSLTATLFVVAVTLGGIANITKRKFLAYVCILIGALGVLNLTTIILNIII